MSPIIFQSFFAAVILQNILSFAFVEVKRIQLEKQPEYEISSCFTKIFAGQTLVSL